MPAPHTTAAMVAAQRAFFAARKDLEDAARRAGYEIESIIGTEIYYAPLPRVAPLPRRGRRPPPRRNKPLRG